MTTFDARTLARGWLSVAIASAKDEDRPALDRTVSIEAYPEGLRIAATDSYVLLHAWVPNIEHDLDPEPAFDEAPYAKAVAFDPHGRGKGFLAHALTLAAEAAKADHAPPEIRVELGVVDEEDDGAVLPGLAATYVVVELPDMERLKLPTYEGNYPNWRTLASSFTAQSTKTIALGPTIIGRLAKLGKIQPGTLLGFEWAGELKAAHVALIQSDPHVEGLVMPCRWDFDRNAPREEEPDQATAESVADAIVDNPDSVEEAFGPGASVSRDASGTVTITVPEADDA